MSSKHFQLTSSELGWNNIKLLWFGAQSIILKFPKRFSVHESFTCLNNVIYQFTGQRSALKD